MYIALWTEERLVPNPYWDGNCSNTEPTQIKETVSQWRKLFSDKELMQFLETKEGAKAEYHHAYEIFPELERTVKLKITPSAEAR